MSKFYKVAGAAGATLLVTSQAHAAVDLTGIATLIDFSTTEAAIGTVAGALAVVLLGIRGWTLIKRVL